MFFQIPSFEAEILVPKLASKEGGPETFRGVFICAPAVLEAGPEVEVLADYPVPSNKVLYLSPAVEIQEVCRLTMEVKHRTGSTISGEQMFIMTNAAEAQAVNEIFGRYASVAVLLIIPNFVEPSDVAGIQSVIARSGLTILLYDPRVHKFPCAAADVNCNHCNINCPGKPWYHCLAAPLAAVVICIGIHAKKGPIVNLSVNVDKMVDVSFFKKEKKEKRQETGSGLGFLKFWEKRKE